jgi:antirestriction protein ArdC
MRDQKNWQDLLIEVVNQPGKIMAAYMAFHNYSIGNALLALSQCHQRNLTPGPLNTYKGWQELGRYVRKGEQALTLCMPVSAKKKKIRSRNEAGRGTCTDVLCLPPVLVYVVPDGRRQTLHPSDSWLRS